MRAYLIVSEPTRNPRRDRFAASRFVESNRSIFTVPTANLAETSNSPPKAIHNSAQTRDPHVRLLFQLREAGLLDAERKSDLALTLSPFRISLNSCSMARKKNN